MTQTSSDAPQPVSLQDLSDFVAPSMPTDDRVRMLLNQAKSFFGPKDSDVPVVAADHLRDPLIDGVLDPSTVPPVCDPLLDEVQATFGAEQASRNATRLVVLPPCDRNDTLRCWAERSGHEVLEPPTHAALLGDDAVELPDLTGTTTLVIPQLERWFARRRKGLTAVRGLLQAISKLERPCVVGCNSWAWPFLVTAVDASMFLPSPMTFRAFDAPRLQS